VETWEWIVLAAAAGAALLLLVALVSIRRRRGRLVERFGPEYDRAVASSGRSDAERRLSTVQQEHDDLDEQVDGAQGTENLRRAMLDFRAVFEEVVEEARAA
jgi:hypothetical protein